MERKEIDRLINRLNKLSDNPTKNLNKMREIARVLVDFYMPNKNIKWKLLNAKDVEKK